MLEKTCSKCSVVKPVSEFRPQKGMKDGLRSECKECARILAKQYRERLGPEERRLRNKIYRKPETQARSQEKRTQRYQNDEAYREEYAIKRSARYNGISPEESARRRIVHLSKKSRVEESRKRKPDEMLTPTGRAYRHDAEYRQSIRDQQNSKTHGISSEEYKERRDRPCEICGEFKLEPGQRGGGMQLDHDHETNKLRGTLCGRCNRGVGLFDDKPERLRAAAEYIERYERDGDSASTGGNGRPM